MEADTRRQFAAAIRRLAAAVLTTDGMPAGAALAASRFHWKPPREWHRQSPDERVADVLEALDDVAELADRVHSEAVALAYRSDHLPLGQTLDTTSDIGPEWSTGGEPLGRKPRAAADALMLVAGVQELATLAREAAARGRAGPLDPHDLVAVLATAAVVGLEAVGPEVRGGVVLKRTAQANAREPRDKRLERVRGIWIKVARRYRESVPWAEATDCARHILESEGGGGRTERAIADFLRDHKDEWE